MESVANSSKTDNQQKWYEKVRAEYRQWLHAPYIRRWHKGDPEEVPGVYVGPVEHFCSKMPKGYYAWKRPTYLGDEEEWVISKPNYMGELVKTCPYCKAKLTKGEGDRYQRKWFTSNWHSSQNVRSTYKFDEIDEEEKLHWQTNLHPAGNGYIPGTGIVWTYEMMEKEADVVYG